MVKRYDNLKRLYEKYPGWFDYDTDGSKFRIHLDSREANVLINTIIEPRDIKGFKQILSIIDFFIGKYPSAETVMGVAKLIHAHISELVHELEPGEGRFVVIDRTEYERLKNIEMARDKPPSKPDVPESHTHKGVGKGQGYRSEFVDRGCNGQEYQSEFVDRSCGEPSRNLLTKHSPRYSVKMPDCDTPEMRQLSENHTMLMRFLLCK